MKKKRYKKNFSLKVYVILVLLATLLFTYGCKSQNESGITQESTTDGTTQGVETTTEDLTNEVTESPTTEEVPYATATPGVPDELKDSEYDLTKTLNEPALKDDFHKYFSIGVGINGSNPSNAMVESPELRAVASYHFNSMTYTNLMKSSYILDPAGCIENAENGDNTTVAVKFDSCIPGLDFAKENGMGMRGHVLVWHTQVPEWFFKEGYINSNDFVDKDTMLARMESYIKQVLEFTHTNYPGVIYAWDVVNECVETATGMYDDSTGWKTRTHYGDKENLWYKVIGPDYVVKAYEYARKYADPEVKLFYNDYNTFEFVKTIAICNLLKMLKEKDLIDGIGMQSAFGLTYPSSLTNGVNSTREALERFAALDIEIHMSEVTLRIKDESEYEAQAKRYKEFMDLLLKMHKANGGPANITNVTFFGIMDRYLMYDNHTECHWLFDADLQPKPSFYSIVESLEEYKNR